MLSIPSNVIQHKLCLLFTIYKKKIYKQIKKIIFFLLKKIFRGISSTVRRCIDKETGKEFAAKIIDLGADGTGDVSCHQMLEATRQEIQILRQVMGHIYISLYSSFLALVRLIEDERLIWLFSF